MTALVPVPLTAVMAVWLRTAAAAARKIQQPVMPAGGAQCSARQLQTAAMPFFIAAVHCTTLTMPLQADTTYSALCNRTACGAQSSCWLGRSGGPWLIAFRFPPILLRQLILGLSGVAAGWECVWQPLLLRARSATNAQHRCCAAWSACIHGKLAR